MKVVYIQNLHNPLKNSNVRKIKDLKKIIMNLQSYEQISCNDGTIERVADIFEEVKNRVVEIKTNVGLEIIVVSTRSVD